VLDAIPGVLIHGKLDVSGPLETAWRLHRNWSASELHIVEDMGHGGGQTFTGLVMESVSRLGPEAR
jgi:proline iminopeptidase